MIKILAEILITALFVGCSHGNGTEQKVDDMHINSNMRLPATVTDEYFYATTIGESGIELCAYEFVSSESNVIDSGAQSISKPIVENEYIYYVRNLNGKSELIKCKLDDYSDKTVMMSDVEKITNIHNEFFCVNDGYVYMICSDGKLTKCGDDGVTVLAENVGAASAGENGIYFSEDNILYYITYDGEEKNTVIDFMQIEARETNHTRIKNIVEYEDRVYFLLTDADYYIGKIYSCSSGGTDAKRHTDTMLMEEFDIVDGNIIFIGISISDGIESKGLFKFDMNSKICYGLADAVGFVACGDVIYYGVMNERFTVDYYWTDMEGHGLIEL